MLDVRLHHDLSCDDHRRRTSGETRAFELRRRDH
jgi:hypothetical protein